MATPTVTRKLTRTWFPSPGDFTGPASFGMEHIAEEYNTVHGLDVLGLRPTAVFGLGRGQRGSYGSRLAPIPETPHFMVLPELAALGEPITMPPDQQETDWIYAADAAEAWYCALEASSPEHRVFNMRSERRQIGEVTAHLRRILPDAQISVSDRPVNLNHIHLMNNERLRTELGFQARYTMETGMVDYLNKVRSQAGLPPVAPA